LGSLGRGQVHRDAAVGVVEGSVLDRHAHAIARLAHRRFGQTDDTGAGQAAGQVHFHHHLRRGDPFLGAAQRNRKAHAASAG